MLELLYEEPGLAEFGLPEELLRLYGGGLGLEGPCLVANFVETIDGVVAIPDVPKSNALVSDSSEADRLVMGLLRARADAILIGSGTLAGSPRGTWRAERVYPAGADAFAELRRMHSLAPQPVVAVVTTGRTLDLGHPLLAEGALLLTTSAGESRLRGALPEATEVVAVNDGERVDLRLALELLRRRGHEVILSEAGPTTFAELVAAGLVDDLFLTISPVLAGRAGSTRFGLAEGIEFLPDSRVGWRLRSARRAGNHLLLRYALSPSSFGTT
jgi:riboflavin biosynthesis pyrimidine reductase